MLPALLALIPLLVAQKSEPVSTTPFDRVLELEIHADDEPAIEGRGPTAVAEYEVEFKGTLHVWTTSELDLFLQVDDAAEARILASDDNSGGGTTPYLALDVEPGDWLVILVAGDPGSTGPLTLHLIAAPETEAGRAAEKAARDALRDAAPLVNEGQQAAARDLMARALPRVLDAGGSNHADLRLARSNLASSMEAMGDLAGARALDEAVLASYERILPEDHPNLLRARANLALSMYAMGDLAGARALDEAVLASYERTLPEDHPDLLRARGNLASTRHALGDLAGARALRESALAAYERVLPEDNPDLLAARANLAVSMYTMGDLAGARALQESVLAVRERILPEDHPDLLRARASLAISMYEMGDLAGARALREAVLAGYERTLPEDHPDLLAARMNLAVSISATGDLAGAHALREVVLAGYERTLLEDHPDLLRARSSLANSMHAMGDLAGARALYESVLAARERTRPEDHPDLLLARSNLAVSMYVMGDLAGARALHEAVLAARERILPEDHPDLLAARNYMASSMWAMGDLAGARALYEAVLAARERLLPEDHPDLLRSRTNLASSMSAMGDLAEPRALREAILASYERTRPEDHPDLLRARANLAVSMHEMDDLAGARALRESVLASYESILPEDHPALLHARANLADSMHSMGDFTGARALDEAALAAYERILPEDHPDLLRARMNLAASMYAMVDIAGAHAVLLKLVAGMRMRILASLALAPRQSQQTVATEDFRHSRVLFFSESAGAELARSVFQLTETMRLVAGEAARALAGFEADSELAPILEEAAEVRSALNDLVAGAARETTGAEALSAEFTRLSLRRDRLERDASRRLAERGVVTQPVEAGPLAAALSAGEVAVGFRRIGHWYVDEGSGRLETGADHLMAHILAADGTLERIDLGPALELEELAASWRAALGAPLLRGIGLSFGSEDPELDAGAKLRARILDPVLALAGEDVKRIFVCADDLLFLLPLDALPFDGAGGNDAGAEVDRVGDRLRIVNEVSFARLLAPAPPPEAEPSLLAFGGVDYDATGAAPEGLTASSAPIEADDRGESDESEDTARAPGDGSDDSEGEARSSRSAMPERFQKLLQARYEAEATADLFEEAFELEPSLLTRKKTTKAALFESAGGKRYLHLATHGWFAPETVRSIQDAGPSDQGFARMGIEDRVSGLAPMTLCGLALAGANRGRDSLGRVPGILTAEELCSLDLSQCELAVLSACETNVGIRRAGQGIQSLQSALYAAGARTSITSLWKVDDAATRRLMEVFYTNLWIDNLPKAEALWQAKQALRDEGHPPAHWAGWVLTGDPE